jgi:CRISPR-associated endonuclease/helicase Cas3
MQLIGVKPVETPKLVESLAGELAGEALKLLADLNTDEAAHRIVVFCDRRDVAEGVEKQLKETRHQTILFIGARRNHEREQAKTELVDAGFLPPPENKKEKTDSHLDNAQLNIPVFLVATSAAEVGIDLDAQHMVSDLVPWERMVQRLGRVNRRGEHDHSRVRVIDVEKGEEEAPWREPLLELFKQLPVTDDRILVSPQALSELRKNADPELVKKASSSQVHYPPLLRAHVDSWALTSLEDDPSRPDVEPWLRGWVKDEPQIRIVWRTHLPLTADRKSPLDQKLVEKYFEAFPVDMSEILEVESWRAKDWLKKRAKNQSGTVAFILGKKNRAVTATEIQDKNFLVDGTLVVRADLGGLAETGLLSDEERTAITADTDSDWSALIGRRIWVEKRPPEEVEDGDEVVQPVASENNEAQGWLAVAYIPVTTDEEGDKEWLVIEKTSLAIDDDEEANSVTSKSQSLEEHQSWTESASRKIAEKLELSNEYTEALALAARLHDEGKRAARWQGAFHAPANEILAKIDGKRAPDFGLLAGYRHEFGSLKYVEANDDFKKLPPDMAELVLHLVVSHHGHARPAITFAGCVGATEAQLKIRQSDVALRFFALQEKWGPWGLAWWESLLRAADIQASIENDKGASNG